MVNRKHAFWQALLSTIIIFGFGLLVGLWIEEARQDKVETLLIKSEINTFDSQLIGEINSNLNTDCDLAKTKLFELADKVFVEAKLMEDYDESSQLSGILNLLHQRYDLLRLMLWGESIAVKERCTDNFHTVVYLFQYEEPNTKVKSEQIAFSRYLVEIKEKHGDKILLIPIATDLDLSSVDTAVENFNIKNIPAIIIDEEIVITNLNDLSRIEDFLFNPDDF